MGVSSAYSEFVCKKLADKGAIDNLGGGMYALTEIGEAEVTKHPPREKKEGEDLLEKKKGAFEAQKQVLKEKWNAEQ